MVDLREFVTARVKHAYRVEDIECTPTTLRILSEIFNIDIDQKVYDAASGMFAGAGRYGAQCGLVQGGLMVVGTIGRSMGMDQDTIGQVCHRLVSEFEREIGSLICRELRPEGFKDDNPPQLCEPRTIDSIVLMAQQIMNLFGLEMNLNPDHPIKLMSK